jgi:hypothetical protein
LRKRSILHAICLALALLCIAFPAPAQDQFNTNTDPSRSAGSGPCAQSYAQAERQVVEARTLNDAQYKKERIDCDGKQDCIKAAQKKYLAGQRKTEKQHTDASAQRDICEQRRQSGIPGGNASSTAPAPPAGAAHPAQPQLPPKASSTAPAPTVGAARPASPQLPPKAPSTAPAPTVGAARPVSPQLPPGAVATGDPDATDAGVPGFLGSFPGTKSEVGSFCYTYLCERNIWNVNPLPTDNPRSVGHDKPSAGDAVLVYQRIKNTKNYLPVHFAVYQGNGIYYQRNGASSVEVVSHQFFQNFSNAIIRYVNPTTGK